MAGINILDKLNQKDSGVPILEEERSGGKKSLFSGIFKKSSAPSSPEDQQRLLTLLLGVGVFFGAQYFVKDYTQRLTSEKEVIVAQLDQKLGEERRRANELKEVRLEADRHQQRIDELKAKLKKVEDLGKNRNYLVRAVDFVVRQMPRNIWIKEIKLGLLKDSQINLTGSSTSMQTVGDFMERLQPGGFFNSWNLIETRLENSGNTQNLSSGAASSNRSPPNSKSFQISAKVLNP